MKIRISNVTCFPQHHRAQLVYSLSQTFTCYSISTVKPVTYWKPLNGRMEVQPLSCPGGTPILAHGYPWIAPKDLGPEAGYL